MAFEVSLPRFGCINYSYPLGCAKACILEHFSIIVECQQYAIQTGLQTRGETSGSTEINGKTPIHFRGSRISSTTLTSTSLQSKGPIKLPLEPTGKLLP